MSGISTDEFGRKKKDGYYEQESNARDTTFSLGEVARKILLNASTSTLLSCYLNLLLQYQPLTFWRFVHHDDSFAANCYGNHSGVIGT
ncbi:Peptidyl-tRNA hydrolase [Frankliniella fusca]|uniref:Peptidyl-tRNA hydrolase n=1 Tax=Frankliniella fusca TaxID=407009 RepID=A0AAE1H2T8_9NEOP|nr:Peptidyl-tRNA hydrolase [Frankliniella fusca]